MNCGDQNMYHCSPTIITSQSCIVQFFPTSLPTGLNTIQTLREQCWHSGESTGPPPRWPRFDSWIGLVCGLSLLVLFSALIGFFLGTLVFPSRQKPTFELIWFDFLSPQLVEPLCSAKYTWDINEVMIIIIILHQVICYINYVMLKSLLGNEMLCNSWVHMLHITYF